LKNVRRDGAVVRGNVEHRTSDICAVHTGVGAAKCEERLGNFLRAETPELLIASGFCGGTTDELHPGDLVIADDASDLSRKSRAQKRNWQTRFARSFMRCSCRCLQRQRLQKYFCGR